MPASITLSHLHWSTPDGQPVLTDLSLGFAVERTGLVGRNGVGKTSVLGLITGTVTPWSGMIARPVPFALLDQRVAMLDPALSIAENFRGLHPGMDENGCRAALACFRFRADAALRIVRTLSGGQMLRAGLACVLACVLGGTVPPPLLILDEPTNHLDLESVAAIEGGLCAYDGALLMVSHDDAFPDAIGIERRVAPARK